MKYPRKIQIGCQEGTCPLKCKKCHAFGEHVKNVKKVQKMPLEKVKQLVDEISQFGVVPAIQPSIFTEPFANEDLKEIIPYCARKKVPMNIITNGILLNREWLDLLIKWLNVDSIISFSLDAVTQTTYEKVRGSYSLAELEKKIEYLIDNRSNNGPRISVSFVYEEDNYDEKALFLEKWKYKVDTVRLNVALDSQRKIPTIYKKETFVKTDEECPFLKESMTIDSGGEVRACPVDAFGKTCLGNVFEEGILAVWNGKNREMLLQRQKQTQLSQDDFCYGCEWGYSIYDFGQVKETDDFIIKCADYAVYYNHKVKGNL